MKPEERASQSPSPRRARIACVPFGYPDYPSADLQRLIASSGLALLSMGLDVVAVPPVIVPDDVPRAVATLRPAEYDAIAAVLVSWVEAPLLVAALRPFRDRPLILWSHTTYLDGDSRVTLGALPAAGVVRETLEEMGFRFRFVYGMPDEAQLAAKMLSFARAAAVVRQLANARIGLFGYASMGMYTGTIDHTRLRAQLGAEIEHQDQYVLIERFKRVTDDEIRPALPRAESWELGEAVTPTDLNRAFRMYAALKALAEESRYAALTVKCQYELSRLFGMAPCLPLSLLGDELVVSCEGDLPLVVSQLILHYLSGGPTSYGDLHHVTEREILLGACGFAPLSCAEGQPSVNKHTALYEGLLNSSPYRESAVTLARLAMKGDGFKMHIAGGRAIPPPKFHEVGCPPYAMMAVALDGDADRFMQNLASQHYAIAYGDVRPELVELCRLLDISIVQ
jgi:L-fucose isomerase-like protein